MSSKCRILIGCLLILTLFVPLLLGCAEEAQDTRRVILIGNIADLTGPAASAIRPETLALHDYIAEINEKAPIPGLLLRVEDYDDQLNPARDLQGYDYLRSKGAEVIIACLPFTAETLKPFAERDKVPVASISPTPAMVDPPGWVFAYPGMPQWAVKTLLQWIAENHWASYPTKPKLATVGWADTYGIAVEKGLKQYCEANPDEFDYVGGLLTPYGQMTWSGEVSQTKDCDYIYLAGLGATIPSTFISEFRSAGYEKAKFISVDAVNAFRSVVIEKVGWDALDGSLEATGWPWWSYDCEVVDEMRDLLYKYHSPDEAEDLMTSGSGYIGGGLCMRAFVDTLLYVIEKVGVDNFDGQAFYDHAVDFQITYGGVPERGFSDTRREFQNEVQVYEFRAADEDMMKVGDWVDYLL